jgi:hypothetical protein
MAKCKAIGPWAAAGLAIVLAWPGAAVAQRRATGTTVFSNRPLDPTLLGDRVTVSVRNPVQPGLSISAIAPTSYDPEAGSAGTLTLNGGSGPTANGWVDVSVKAAANKTYVLDCAVAGAASYYVGFDHSAQGGSEMAVPHGGHIGVLLTARPTASTRTVTIIGQGNLSWTFSACSVATTN